MYKVVVLEQSVAQMFNVFLLLVLDAQVVADKGEGGVAPIVPPHAISGCLVAAMGGKTLREIIVSNLAGLLESMLGLLGSGAAEAFMNEIIKVARR